MAVTNKISTLLKKKQQLTEERRARINPAFVADVAPIGGISFEHERFIRTGTGYEACLYVYSYPKIVAAHWLTLLTGIEDTICVLDIGSTNKTLIKKNLRQSLDEQQTRYRTARSDGDAIDAQQQYAELEEMYQEVSSYGNVMKSLLARIYVSGKTMYEVDRKISEIISDLEGSGFQCAVGLSETKSEWRNTLLPYEQQKKTIYRKEGQPILSKAIAGGNPFHFSSLNDPNGMYFGVTQTGGAILFDLFRKTKIRMSYDFVAIGKKGSGKSTTLKKLMLDRAISGDMVRVFDVTGEFARITKILGGQIISLDGQTDSIINILQILPDENPHVAYNKHVSKVSVIWRYLKGGEVNDNELLMLKLVLRLLYLQFGFCNEEGQLIRDLEQVQPEEFPILSDMSQLVQSMINEYDLYEEEIRELGKIRKHHIPILEDIELKLNDLCMTYGRLFDGHTTVRNFYNEKVVCFNMKNLAAMEESIYDAQLYNALSVCWDNCVMIGSEMKEQYQNKTIDEKDIMHSLILIDEAHKTINANKPAGVDAVVTIIREARKYFAAIGLASQSIRDFVPDHVGQEAVGKMRTLFELTTYKFVMNQDSNVMEKLRDVFQNSFSERELERIPTLGEGECFFSISGDRNLEASIYASDEELAFFDGGR